MIKFLNGHELSDQEIDDLIVWVESMIDKSHDTDKQNYRRLYEILIELRHGEFDIDLT